MALGTTNITTTLVRNILSEDQNAVYHLCTSTAINRWSRCKPVVGSFPAGTTGKYGLNLPTNWNYVQIDSNARLGDFRGYEHDQDIAGPVVYTTAADSSSLGGTLVPHTSPSGYLSGAVTFGMNTVHNDVRIIPSDLGLENYYFGIRLTLPDNSYSYKTRGSVLAHGQSVGVNVTLVNPTTDPSFTDCPYAKGSFAWDAFICSEIKATWTDVAPADIIYLPTGTFGSKTVINHGIFSISDWLIVDNNDMTFAWNDDSFDVVGDPDYQDAVVSTSLELADNWEVKSYPAWMNYKVYDGVMDMTSSPATWDNGFILRLVPDLQEYGAAERSGDIIVGSSTVDMESIHVVQERAPKKYNVGSIVKWASDDSSGLTFNTNTASGYVLEGSSALYITISKSAGPTTLYYKVSYHGTLVNNNDILGWGQITGCTNGTITKALSCTVVADDSCTPIMVTLSGVTS